MALWFHRNSLKATTHTTFKNDLIFKNEEAQKICSDLKDCRARLLTLISDPSCEIDQMESVFHLYVALVHGFITRVGGDQGPSKLRYNFIFKWTHSLLGNAPQKQRDMVFEVANMFCNAAIWLMKHAAYKAAKEDITMDEAKEVHRCLRKAAGLFRFIGKEHLPQLAEKPREGGDLDPRVNSAYMNQCTAEAQEVTVGRAIELKHNAALISSLAYETSSMFSSAAKDLAPIKEAEQWRTYLRLKAELYLAYAYNFNGDNLLSLDKCGMAIRALKESQACYARSEELCKEYGKLKGKGNIAKPERHPFFRKLGRITKLTLDKCERENGFIYHQKVPDELPELEMKATYGLASPEEFSPPPPSPLWTETSYEAMVNVGKTSDPATSDAATKVEGDLPPVKEKPVLQPSKEPKTDSGCSIQ